MQLITLGYLLELYSIDCMSWNVYYAIMNFVVYNICATGMNDYLELTKTTRVQAPDYEEMSFTAAPPSDTTPQQ